MLARRAAWFLVGFSIWNAWVWATFVSNVYPQHHWDTFFVVHLLIGSVTTLAGFVAGGIGGRALRVMRRAATQDAEFSPSPPTR